MAASIGIGVGGNVIASLLWGWVSPKQKSEACLYRHAVQPPIEPSTETATAAGVEGRHVRATHHTVNAKDAAWRVMERVVRAAEAVTPS